MKKSIITSALILSSTFTFAFDLGTITKGVVENISNTQKIQQSSNELKTNNSKTNLNDSTVTSGLKEALKTGVNFAVKELGAKDGYLNNSKTKIPLPDNLAKAESIIRGAGGDKIADNLINSMNSAATKAAPQTAEIFMNAIDKMSLSDAQAILSGKNDAATSYFKTNTSDSLRKLISPIVQETMKENQVSSYYNTANDIYKSNVKGLVDNSSVMGLAKNFGVDSYIPGNSDENLDEFVTNKTIEGLFTMIAQKEAAIRANPMEQTSSILKQVFGK